MRQLLWLCVEEKGLSNWPRVAPCTLEWNTSNYSKRTSTPYLWQSFFCGLPCHVSLCF